MFDVYKCSRWRERMCLDASWRGDASSPRRMRHAPSISRSPIPQPPLPARLTSQQPSRFLTRVLTLTENQCCRAELNLKHLFSLSAQFWLKVNEATFHHLTLWTIYKAYTFAAGTYPLVTFSFKEESTLPASALEDFIFHNTHTLNRRRKRRQSDIFLFYFYNRLQQAVFLMYPTLSIKVTLQNT